MPGQSPSNDYLAQSTAPVFIAERDITQRGIALWSVQVGCPGSIPSQALAHPQPLRSRAKVGKRDSVMLCQRGSAAAETTVCHQHSETLMHNMAQYRPLGGK